MDGVGKDYDCLILYHPSKANVITNALSHKSVSNLAYLVSKEKKLMCLYPKFKKLSAQLEITNRPSILAHMTIQSMMVDCIKKAQK